MMKFPMKFEVEATATQGIRNTWSGQSGSLPPIPSAIPPEFMGPGGGYSPEDLFALALLNCLIATFKVYCEKSKISFESIKSRAILTVDKQPAENFIWMKHVEVFIDVNGSSDPDKARQLLDSSLKDCAVSQSIKSGKTFHLKVN
jgi:organic hydroperoxide reductase OsmC/OhrA